jgi:alkanesulfonate monooxygenase SsuD/methylene tetrahydromethanopterin reductase-like flavin-dependent oxidoreductase (luciferase family)
MKFGIAAPTSHQGVYLPSPFASPEEICALVERADALGFHSAWGLDYMTPRGTEDRSPDNQLEWHEILISLAYMAARTKSIRLGTASLQLPLRDPFLLARQAATLDLFSQGRFMLGIGLGTDRTEYVRIRPQDRKIRRGDLFLESIEALYKLLGEEKVTYQGQHYRCEDVSVFPRPVQNPLPLYISGTTDDTPRRIANWGAGWLLSRAQIRKLDERLDSLDIELEKVGRNRNEIDLVVTKGLSIANSREAALEKFYSSVLPRRMDSIAKALGVGEKPSQDLDLVFEQNLIGTPDDILEQLEKLSARGLSHCVLYYFPVSSPQEMMDQMAWFGESVLKKYAT